MILVTENPQIQGFPVEKVKTTTWGYHGNIMKISWEYHIMGICSAQYDTRIIYIYIYVWVINE